MTGLTSALGSGPLYNLAIGASLALLALVATKSPGEVNLGSRLANLRRRALRLRQRIDRALIQILGQNHHERPRSRPAARPYQSKHRMSAPPKQSRDSKPAPRHAAPPAD